MVSLVYVSLTLCTCTIPSASMYSHTASLILYTQSLRQLVLRLRVDTVWWMQFIDGVNDSNGTITMEVFPWTLVPTLPLVTTELVLQWVPLQNETSGTIVEQEGGVFIYDLDRNRMELPRSCRWRSEQHTLDDLLHCLPMVNYLLSVLQFVPSMCIKSIHRGTLTPVGSDIAVQSGSGTGLAFTQPTAHTPLLASFRMLQ